MSTRTVRLPIDMANPKRELSAQDWDDILHDWDSGLALLPLARKWHTSRNRLRRLLTEAGRDVVARPAKGEGHKAWKGGRGRDSKGYITVLLRPSDPLWCMANRKGRVLEHRLVMARHLGRPLDSNETVHHIDGNKENNLIQNLQLRSSFHGPGTCYECQDCGSRNVTAVEL